MLRQIPTFSLFRRTSSLAAHPTAQGVSLRGIGPSGVSRTLVLLDGVPFNDPFGGWVYWTRVPLDSADRIEIVDGTELEPVRQLRDGRRHQHRDRAGRCGARVELKPQYGNRSSPKVDFFASDVWGKLGVVARRRGVFDTDGYPIVVNQPGRPGRARARSTRTRRSTSERSTLKADYAASDNVQRVRPGRAISAKSAINGKASTIDGTDEKNDTQLDLGERRRAGRLPDGSDLQASVFTDFERFRSNFLAVPGARPRPRSIGRMTLNQRVPTKAVGGMAQWSRAFGGEAASSAPAPTSAGSTATAKRMVSTR